MEKTESYRIFDRVHAIKIIVGVLMLAILLLAYGVSAAIEINSCTKISSPGIYVVNTDIMSSAGKTCISIHSNNVVLDGNGHTITGNGVGDGVNLKDSKGVTIRNFYIRNFNNGIYLKNSKNNNIANNIIISSSNNGIYLKDSKDNDLYSNNVNSNADGIYLEDSKNNNIFTNFVNSNKKNGINLKDSKNNVIYNNIFNNTNNFKLDGSVNKWSITKTQGINIIGGMYLGGNAWDNPSGTGFSETCADGNSDGICDSSYTLASKKNIDYLPLAYKLSIPVTTPPAIIGFAPDSPISNAAGVTRTFSITTNQTVNVTWYLNGTQVQFNESVTNANYTNTSAASGTWIVNATATNANGTVSKEWTWNVTSSGLPPDPVTVAPPVDSSVATNLATSIAFLYSGSNPIQSGVAPGTIEARRVAVLRGRVLTREGTPLSGVNISILSHPEFGQTMSRVDGMFDMAVNGGGLLTVNYERKGYLTVQRHVQTPWQDYVWLPDVVLIQADTNVTAINLSSSEPIQIARGSVVNDSDGMRQATLLFPQGTQANMTLPDGTIQPLTSMHVRATEYTIGESGPQAMPAELPPTSAYTYAVEFSVDEAMAAGARDVSFDKPVYFYVENFLNFPVGGIVPVGYYNRSLGQWIPSDNGRIIKILTITGGMADLDVDGSNQSANASQLSALNIKDAEREQLAALYQPNQSLWRVPITHFTPWDCNWPYGPPPGARPPNQPSPRSPNPPVDKPDENPCGSIIGCQNQVLKEAVNIIGTSFRLHYQSDRVPGRQDAYILNIPLSGAGIPMNLGGIILEIEVAGRKFTQTFPAQPNLRYTFAWDGKDAYGRTLQGAQPVTVRIGYVYGAIYYSPAQFNQAFGSTSSASGGSGGGGQSVVLTANFARQEITFWQVWEGSIGSWEARSQGIGGWSLNVHHAYDSTGKVLYLGDGGRRSAQALGGVITTVAGNGDFGYSGDGGSATQAQLSDASGVAVSSDGSFYIADTYRIRRVGTEGNITTVAGNGYYCYAPISPCGDGGPATQAQLNGASGVAVGSDGSFYIADSSENRIRRVGTDGNITTVAGNGIRGYGGDGGPATQAQLNRASGVAVGSDGSLYIADSQNHRIRKVFPALPGYSFYDIIIPAEDSSELYVFDRSGKHMRTLDALTGTVRFNFTYDSAGRLTAVIDGDGNVLTIERDASGNATAIISPYGQRTNLTLDANGYLASMTNPAGESVKLSYTNAGLLTNLTDPRSNTYNYSYDASGRLIRDEDPEGGVKTLERTDTADGYSVKLATGLNRNTTYKVERLSTGGQRRVNTLPDGLKTEAIIGTNGSQTLNYPDGTRITLLQGPDPRFGMQAPVLKNQTIKTPGGLTQITTSERSVILADPNDPLSLQNLTETVSINGRTYISTFNATSKNVTRRTPMGRETIATLDNKSRIVKWHIPGLIPTNFTYDDRGRLRNITQGTRTYVFSYDAQGNLANLTDPLFRATSFEYDLAGRDTRQILPDRSYIRYAYDANSNIIYITPPGRPNHSFNYTAVDMIKEYMPPVVGAGTNLTRYTYNIDRQLTNVTRPDGATIDYAYDGAGRLSMITSPEGATNLEYNPATAKLKNITVPDGSKITYAYDGSLPTDINWSGTISGSVHSTYDNNFRIISEGVNGANIINFHYDLDGLMTRAGSLNLSRDPQNGVLTGSALANVTNNLTYNSFGEVAAYQTAYSGVSIFSVNYTRDDLGRIVKKNETIGGVTHTYSYTHDKAGRLANISKDDIVVSQNVYDANGNRISYTTPSSATSATYDNQDRLMQFGTITYTYTANGELLSRTAGSQTTTYRYDVMGNLKNVTMPDGTKIEYIIDGQNRRIGKKVNGALVQGFLYTDKLNPIAELDGANNVVSRFIYGSRDNVPDYMVKGGATYRIITDHLGSPRLVIDVSTGAIVQRVDYDEFGRVIADSNPGFQPFGFAGGIYDRSTKLVRFGWRDYDAETGRWTAKDPMLFVGSQSNLYLYVDGDPINRRDPTGLGDLPGTWDNGVVTNNSDHVIIVIDVDNNRVYFLGPGETSDPNIDIDFIDDEGRVTKVGANEVMVNEGGTIELIEKKVPFSEDPRPATPKERKDVEAIIPPLC